MKVRQVAQVLAAPSHPCTRQLVAAAPVPEAPESAASQP